jgi:SSS family solute:Na+ symporter
MPLTAGETVPWIKGAWLGAHITYTSSMAQNFWLAIVAWSVCFVMTIIISLSTKRTRTDEELKGLVYALTPKIKEANEPVWLRPAFLGVLVLAVAVILNIIFW